MAKRKVVRRSALAALATAWLQTWAQRTDQRLTWQDAAVLTGLAAAWWMENRIRTK